MSVRKSPSLIQAGDKFNRLTVISYSHQDQHKRKHFLVRCDCGTEKSVQGSLMTSGNTGSCGCLHKDYQAAKRVPGNHSEVTAIILGYKRHAKGRGYEWKLSRSDVISIIFSNCRYCGSPPSNTKRHKNTVVPLLYNGIDRIDNERGYILGNVSPCCRICNRAKETLTIAEFSDWAKSIGAMATQWTDHITRSKAA